MRRLINFLLYAVSILLLTEHFGWTDIIPFIPHQSKTEQSESPEEDAPKKEQKWWWWNKETTPQKETNLTPPPQEETASPDTVVLFQTNKSIDSLSRLVDSLQKLQQVNLAVDKANIPTHNTNPAVKDTTLLTIDSTITQQKPVEFAPSTDTTTITDTLTTPSSDTTTTTITDTLAVDTLNKPKPVLLDSTLRDTIGSLYPIQPPKPNLGFALQCKKNTSSLPITSVFLMPKEMVRFATVVQDTLPETKFKVTSSVGKIRPLKNNQWAWQAPVKTGVYPIVINRKNTTDSMTIQCIVQVPANKVKEEKLNDFPIGKYPASHQKHKSLVPPKGFVLVDQSNENTLVSPHYQLKDFLCNQAEKGQYPNYIVLNEQLLAKLELLTNVLQQTKIPFDHFSILSSYRTPYYNSLKKNKPYSRHQWGMAADLFIDQDGDSVMDDLNQDGQLTGADAEVLYHILDQLQNHDWYKPFIGGMGLYKENKQRTSFVHVDVGRSMPIRWVE